MSDAQTIGDFNGFMQPCGGPLKSALLMQTLARVNRTFRNKQDGLLVAYAPLVENLEKALAEFTLNGGECR